MTRLLNDWKAAHRIVPSGAEVFEACHDLVATHEANMKTAFWNNPGTDAPDIPKPRDVDAVEDKLREKVQCGWPHEREIADQVAALETRLIADFLRAFRHHLPPPEEDGPFLAERIESALETVRRGLGSEAVAQELSAVPEKRLGSLRKKAKKAVEDELDRPRRMFSIWSRELIDERIEPKDLQDLFTSRKQISIGYEALGANFVNDDLHLEDQMFFGVDLVVSPQGQLCFELEPLKGGLMHALRGWQRGH